MGCPDYRDLPCDCSDGGLKEHPDTGSLRYIPNDGETGDKILICFRCNGLTTETVYVHVDKNLLGPKGIPGKCGKPRTPLFRGFKTRWRRRFEVFNTLGESIGIRGRRGS